MTEEQPLTFEQAMAKLEAIVDQLEEGDVPLEDALAYFQEGMKLSKLCHDKLQSAQKQMDHILHENGEMKPFLIQEDDET